MLNHPLLILGFSLVLLWLSAYVGAQIGKRGVPLDDQEREGFQVTLAAALTLLGLIVGFSFSMAVSRYDRRKDCERDEANAIGTEYVRAGLLPPARGDRIKELLRGYLDQRILFYEERAEPNVQWIDARTFQLERRMWSAVQSEAATQPAAVVTLTAGGMNDVLNAHGYSQAAWWNRIPGGAWILMAVISACCCMLMGYVAHNARPSLRVILPVVLSIAFFFIRDIDSPRHGLIQVIPQNLISLSDSLRSE